jgi:hypothetical protein
MRSFLAACLAVIVITLGAAAVLSLGMQRSAADAFATSAVRL